MPFDIGGPMLSAAAIADPPDFDRARAVARFDGLMRELIHAFKFHDSHNARRLFGRWLAEAGQEILSEADLLVAVPLARWRLISRRFNQAQILAAETGRLAGKPVRPFALTRTRSTAHQIGLSRAQRSRNVAGAFRVPASELPAISGKAIVLVDDVITSGATASAAAAALETRRSAPRRRAGVGDRLESLSPERDWRGKAAAQPRKSTEPGCMGSRTRYLLIRSLPNGVRRGADDMSKVTVYTAGNCCYCHMAKDLLRRKGAAFEEIDLTGRSDLRADLSVRAGGRRTVPQIWIGDSTSVAATISLTSNGPANSIRF